MMRYFLQTRNITRSCLALVIFVLLLAGCVIPAPKTVVPSATSRPGISDAMLTAAAKTIVADLQSLNTLTVSSAGPDQSASTEELSTPELASPQPLQPTKAPPTATQTQIATASPEMLLTATSSPLPPPTAASTQTPLATPEQSPTAIPAQPDTAAPPPAPTAALPAIAPTPTEVGQIQPTAPASALITVAQMSSVPYHAPIHEYGEQFLVKEILIAACTNGPWAVFRILNQSQDKLESLSLHIQDLSSGAVLSGPWLSNTPFHNNAQHCAVGNLDLLNAGHEMYLSQMPNASGLSGHTLRATIKLCAKEDLTGDCTQKAIDFIYP